MPLTLGKLDHGLAGGGPWLLGGFYSLADIAMVPFVERIIDLEPDMVAGGAYGAVTDWLARYRDRPAFEAAFFFEGKDSRLAAIRQALGIA